MAGHRLEAQVHLARLANPDLIDRRPHIVIDTPPRHTTQNAEGFDMGIEQHFVCLQRIGPNDKRPAMR
jgi:hypothetical protein